MLLTCKNHQDLVWRCKDIAYSPEANEGKGGYNGMRNIFFFGFYLKEPDKHGCNYTSLRTGPDGEMEVARECSCSAHDLIGIPGTEEGGG